ncbi:hypothetical protein A3H89_04600 [Candidatus Amesbacteria bacterium RIFCSPLOWO2_02_FULL_48_11]|uniref:Uncharacterized protein n=3 Tax=Candidatus Amesiibacteriota TaxID=1752730 RepID=A0A1F4Z730_9BACT|nr:MAG: hypothetical protein UY22_C0044G0002 [Candidatus Amesbacteria bacterium GW2011_GWC1_48_10]KKW00905.1 MAG: hypothetical protein UY33_C0003G0033 [Candidatus Amesbacteria bacterium GW2011_GWA1_48_9]OGC91257.1 MAG: hypothetical protein A2V48_02365 [Candidatus Amesbacteria bacterium RBG_19FT_COMBO_48_16]OGC97274.1 MAG: hypothetical protein A3C34_04515 [Candidatus Amesbacteria bacterium RIFCSPHIGHO2_02_FULL_48_21]OGC99253.1 MAG: hypothetical protein A2W16_02545 [Candidatus Amesbacteria bacter
MSFIDNLRGHRPEQPAQDRKEPTLKNLITRRQLLNQAQETLRQAALDESALAISHPHRNSQQNLTSLANGLQQCQQLLDARNQHQAAHNSLRLALSFLADTGSPPVRAAYQAVLTTGTQLIPPERHRETGLSPLLQSPETGTDHRQDFTGRGFTNPPLLQPSRGKS